MKLDEYLINARLNLERIRGLMADEEPKSVAWKRLRTAYIAQEVRIRSRIKTQDRKQRLSQIDDVMTFVIEQVGQMVNRATFKKIKN